MNVKQRYNHVQHSQRYCKIVVPEIDELFYNQFYLVNYDNLNLKIIPEKVLIAFYWKTIAEYSEIVSVGTPINMYTYVIPPVFEQLFNKKIMTYDGRKKEVIYYGPYEPKQILVMTNAEKTIFGRFCTKMYTYFEPEQRTTDEEDVQWENLINSIFRKNNYFPDYYNMIYYNIIN